MPEHQMAGPRIQSIPLLIFPKQMQMAGLGGKGEEDRFKGKAPLLEGDGFASVRTAVDKLNGDKEICPRGTFAVHGYWKPSWSIMSNMRNMASQIWRMTRPCSADSVFPSTGFQFCHP